MPLPKQRIAETMEIRHMPSHGYIVDFTMKDDPEERRVKAASGSPLAQALRLVERLLILSDQMAGYNERV